MNGKMTKGEVLQLASQRDFFVHRYSWSADRLRKMTRRMCKDGELVMVRRDQNGFYYRKTP
jgi:hypothetical protein